MTDRLAPFLDRLSRLSVDDLAVLALPEPDPEERAELMARALAVAEPAGRADDLRRAPGRARDAAIGAFSFRGYEPTWFGLNWGRSLGRADDRAHLLAAIEDAAIAEIVADLLGTDDLRLLREPFERAISMSGSASSASPEFSGSRGRRGIVGITWLVAAFPRVGGAVYQLGLWLNALVPGNRGPRL
jgi:hypothetical protein